MVLFRPELAGPCQNAPCNIFGGRRAEAEKFGNRFQYGGIPDTRGSANSGSGSILRERYRDGRENWTWVPKMNKISNGSADACSCFLKGNKLLGNPCSFGLSMFTQYLRLHTQLEQADQKDSQEANYVCRQDYRYWSTPTS